MSNIALHSTALRRVPLEVSESIAFAQWLDLNNILYFHVPNGGSRNAREAAKFKRCGVKAGVPDYVIPIARKPYHGLIIELKRKEGGTISIEQKWWLQKLKEEGYFAIVAYGWEDAQKITEDYLKRQKFILCA